ncbi:MAG: hypothetical protein ACI4VW_05245 [Acutalibacteraceae bacterium]
MMKKFLKKVLSIALAALTVFGCSVVTYAQTTSYETVSPYYVNITSVSAELSISGIKANCTAALKAKSSMNLSIKMELQKEKSSGYETVETWTASKTGTSLSMSESRLINALSDYRLKVTFTAGSETQVLYRY